MICDFAQYYTVYDWHELPVETAAILACGLPAESRTLKAMNRQRVDIDTLLSAVIADQTALLVWQKTKNGRKNRNRPKSFYKMLTGGYGKTEKEEKSFRTAEDYERERKRLIEGA